MSLKEAYAEGKFRALGITDLGSRARAPYVEKKLPGVGDPASPSLPSSSQIGARLDDLKRFTKLLTSPAGLRFQANQALLQQGKIQNKTENLKGANFKETLKNIGKRVINTVAGNVGATATILAQIPVNGTGTHFVNPINGPAYLREEGGNGLDNFFTNTLKLPFNPLSFTSGKISSKLLKAGGDKGVDKKFPIDDTLPTRESLHSQFEGPINAPSNISDDDFYVRTNDGRVSIESGHVDNDKEPKQITYVRTIPTRNGKVKKDLRTSDFSPPDYSKLSADTLTGVYKVKTNSFDEDDAAVSYLESPVYIKNKYELSDKTQVDGIMHTPYDEYTVTENLQEATELIGTAEGKDIIPFYFNVYSPDKGRVLFFRSFLDSWSDSYTGEWSNTKYIGRAEPFFTYNGFNRTVSFSFKLAAFNKSDLTPMYEKLNFLLGSTAPTYGQNGQFMRGTLVNLTIGDLLDKVDGFISSIDLTWNTSYQWEISADEGLEQVPHVLDVSVNFTPIHNFNVKYDLDQSTHERYVGRRKEPSSEPKPTPAPTPKPKPKPPVPKPPKPTPKPPIPPIPLTPPTPIVDLDLVQGTAYSDTVQPTTDAADIGVPEKLRKDTSIYIID